MVAVSCVLQGNYRHLGHIALGFHKTAIAMVISLWILSWIWTPREIWRGRWLFFECFKKIITVSVKLLEILRGKTNETMIAVNRDSHTCRGNGHGSVNVSHNDCGNCDKFVCFDLRRYHVNGESTTSYSGNHHRAQSDQRDGDSLRTCHKPGFMEGITGTLTILWLLYKTITVSVMSLQTVHRMIMKPVTIVWTKTWN